VDGEVGAHCRQTHQEQKGRADVLGEVFADAEQFRSPRRYSLAFDLEDRRRRINQTDVAKRWREATERLTATIELRGEQTRVVGVGRGRIDYISAPIPFIGDV
jgi:hypothetical protein